MIERYKREMQMEVLKLNYITKQSRKTCAAVCTGNLAGPEDLPGSDAGSVFWDNTIDRADHAARNDESSGSVKTLCAGLQNQFGAGSISGRRNHCKVSKRFPHCGRIFSLRTTWQ